MKNKLFAPNLATAGRVVRAILALLLFGAAFFPGDLPMYLRVLLGISGAFTLFEALRGWCLLRACGIKTRL